MSKITNLLDPNLLDFNLLEPNLLALHLLEPNLLAKTSPA